jgi:predicted enzyme related to lactoylglutathione lyase
LFYAPEKGAPMSGPLQAGLFIYAKDVERVVNFYESVLGLSRLHATKEMVVLPLQNIQLIVHYIPDHIASTFEITTPPQHREDTALKFFFTVQSIANARTAAAALGGEVFDEQWQGPGFNVCNACDPEGNIFQVRESNS